MKILNNTVLPNLEFYTINTLQNKHIKIIVTATLLLLGLILCLMLDRPLYHWAAQLNNGMGSFLQLCKDFGYLGFWVFASLALLLQDFNILRKSHFKSGYQRSLLLFTVPFFSGLAAEILKLFIRRERPQTLLFTHSVFREWSGEWWKSNDLSTPSSHAAVAFGATWALCLLLPRPKLLWLGIGVLCGLSRVVQQAHLPSDIYLAAVVSYFICNFLAKKLGINPSDTIGEIQC